MQGLSREIEEQPLENIYLHRTYILEGSQKKTYYISKVQTIFVISAMEINKLKIRRRSSGVKEKKYWNFKWDAQGYKSIHIQEAQGEKKFSYELSYQLVFNFYFTFFYLDISQLK